MKIKIQTVNFTDIQEDLAQGNGLLLDVRNLDEYQEIHVKESLLIPLDTLEQNLSKLESHKDKPIYIHCHSGVRSLRASHFLIEKGFSQIYNIKGGIVEIEKKMPSVIQK